jgi:hypothetical protein
MKKLVYISLIVFLLGFCYSQHKSIKKGQEEIFSIKHKVDSAQKLVDSISSEILVHEIQVGRYEYAIDMLEQENPKAYQALDKILSNTE